jgi:protein required for attachment to host cells
VRVRIVVADQGEARFYESSRRETALRLAGRITDPNAHLHDRDFKSDRPGRVYNRAPVAGARRGAVAHHATGGERRPRKHAAELFARRIAETLGAEGDEGFDRLVLMAGPSFLGALRNALSRSLRDKVVAEVRKDLVHQQDEAVLRSHLTDQMFAA